MSSLRLLGNIFDLEILFGERSGTFRDYDSRWGLQLVRACLIPSPHPSFTALRCNLQSVAGYSPHCKIKLLWKWMRSIQNTLAKDGSSIVHRIDGSLSSRYSGI